MMEIKGKFEMIPTYRSSKPCNHTHPRQKRWNDWGHGPIIPMDRPDGEPPIWVGGFVILGFAVMLWLVAVICG